MNGKDEPTMTAAELLRDIRKRQAADREQRRADAIREQLTSGRWVRAGQMEVRLS